MRALMALYNKHLVLWFEIPFISETENWRLGTSKCEMTEK